MPHGLQQNPTAMTYADAVTALRVLIADDDPLVLVGLRYLLRALADVEIVAEASDGAEIVPLLRSMQVDVVLSDIKMRRTSGMSVIPAIRAQHPDVRIVLMSSVVGDSIQRHALNAGADACFSKSARPDQILAALSGLTPAPRSAGSHALTEREESVASRAAAGASNLEISQELGLSINSVKTYVSRAMTKLGVHNRVQLANVINSRL